MFVVVFGAGTAGVGIETPVLSLELMALIGASGQSSVGGGASRLVDCVIARGYEDVMVLDASEGRSQLQGSYWR